MARLKRHTAGQVYISEHSNRFAGQLRDGAIETRTVNLTELK